MRGTPRAATSDNAASREERRALAAWKGRRYTYHGNVAFDIKFDDRPPYGVVAPPMAVAGLGDALRCARGKLDVSALAAALDALPRKLSWGRRGDAEMARSKRKYFQMTPEEIELAVRGGDGVSRQTLLNDLEECNACTPELAARVKALMGLAARRRSPRYAGELSAHRVPAAHRRCKGRRVLGVRGDRERVRGRARRHLRGGRHRDRNHMQTPTMPCGPGCGCRISFNCRFGVRSALE